MFYIADLHTHSRYAQATSKFLNLETMYQWAQVKGINVVGTGDFTHPAWFAELQEKLQPDGNGFFKLKQPPSAPALPGLKVKDTDVRFCLSAEISSVYVYNNRVRKNHNLVYAPDFDTAARISQKLSHYTDLAADGRPTIALSSRDLLELLLSISEQAWLVPAHAWTPWFSTLGSRGGYDSVEECFRDLTPYIFALETGLSSDPAMNRRWSQLDRFTMLSSSDAHSPQKLGREANLFDTALSYDGMFAAVKTRTGFRGTYEFFPEEGKYSWDGHRKCGISLAPAETLLLHNKCPVCGKPLTIGVFHRVELLADRKEPSLPEGDAGFHYIVPLPEILAELHGAGTESKKVTAAFTEAISVFGNEFTLLKDAPLDDIARYDARLAEGIRRMREGHVTRIAGYDGVYGTIKLFEGETPPSRAQTQLSMF
ncbi:MAG: endonuclease Q family protein [Chitinophagaceae bacterium]